MVRLIVAALAAGSRLGPKDAASAQVHDAAARLWTLARKRLVGFPDGVMVLTRHAEAPRTWEGPLTAALIAAGADGDEELRAAAATLLRLASRVGQAEVDLRTATPSGQR
jgi:hypothetical protein